MEQKSEVLETAKNYIGNLKGGIDSIFNYISQGKENDALSLIPDFAEGIEWLSQVLVLTKDVHKKDLNMNELNDLLNEVVEAIENEDYILVGDLFKYEIYEILDQIQQNI
ncbi:hypothetical protein K144313037_15250 [Clostridium tetani]|uniref:DUF8042 domain-containing protein n=1 Tax=Clostridium tetani TaxID=1513 RepID=A0ABC8EEY7_CLOTA|nr:hypothetical protein [Clostridium tetani]CDI49849.1 hypothetical protein BN906_01856 [Clostridium tetani 12124569]AVP54248.1 hypothetical protein C3B72_03585 [Clostridium tetani]KHO38772.1 hypothetical protein OR62_09025 [Clostridium tetani]RXI39576.1 hypothetical protein DP129_07010 [Clostridium tetani]RXI53809.1 hypothetical protein DP131_10825 [Clostridium tetani]